MTSYSTKIVKKLIKKKLFLGECQKLSKDLNDLRQTLEHTKVSIDAETVIQDLQDQHRRAHEEIQNLQTIVNETVDESVNAQNYAKRLFDENERLKQEVSQLRENVTSLVNFYYEFLVKKKLKSGFCRKIIVSLRS